MTINPVPDLSSVTQGSADTPWFIYFIECRDGSIYTGTTTDVLRRYQEHAAGKGARYTRMNPPVRLLGFIAMCGRGAALSAELRFKRLSAADKRKWIGEMAKQL